MSQVRKIIKDRSRMQTEKSQSSGQRIMPETRYTSFSALSVYPWVVISRSEMPMIDFIFHVRVVSARYATVYINELNFLSAYIFDRNT